MGPEVIPALDAAADKGVKVVLVDNNLDDFTKKTAVAATDNVKGGQAAGEYLKSVLKSGDTIGLMEGVRGVPALDARIQGVKDALEGTGVKVIIGGAETKCDSAQGATVAEDLLTREPNLTAIYSACDDPAIAAAKVAKDKGKTVLVMGYDGLPDAAKAIIAGDMTRHDRAVPRPHGRPRRRGRGQRRARARRSSRSSTPAPSWSPPTTPRSSCSSSEPPRAATVLSGRRNRSRSPTDDATGGDACRRQCWSARASIVLVEHAEPADPGPGEALVAVRRVGICGTDHHAYGGTQNFFVVPARARPRARRRGARGRRRRDRVATGRSLRRAALPVVRHLLRRAGAAGPTAASASTCWVSPETAGCGSAWSFLPRTCSPVPTSPSTSSCSSRRSGSAGTRSPGPARPEDSVLVLGAGPDRPRRRPGRRARTDAPGRRRRRRPSGWRSPPRPATTRSSSTATSRNAVAGPRPAVRCRPSCSTPPATVRRWSARSH